MVLRIYLDLKPVFEYGTFTLYGVPSQVLPLTGFMVFVGSPTTPQQQVLRFGLLPFRSPLLRESRLISFPPGTEMFHFPGLLPTFRGSPAYSQQVPPSDIHG